MNLRARASACVCVCVCGDFANNNIVFSMPENATTGKYALHARTHARTLRRGASAALLLPRRLRHRQPGRHHSEIQNGSVFHPPTNSPHWLVAVGEIAGLFPSSVAVVAVVTDSLAHFNSFRAPALVSVLVGWGVALLYCVCSASLVVVALPPGRLDMTLLDEDAKVSMKKRKPKQSKKQREALKKKKQAAEEKKVSHSVSQSVSQQQKNNNNAGT